MSPYEHFLYVFHVGQPLQEEAEVNAQLVSRAKRMVEEQDDEIKKVNELVLHAKCNAIRDAQNAEKGEILQAMKEEEVRCKNVMGVHFWWN